MSKLDDGPLRWALHGMLGKLHEAGLRCQRLATEWNLGWRSPSICSLMKGRRHVYHGLYGECGGCHGEPGLAESQFVPETSSDHHCGHD